MSEEEKKVLNLILQKLEVQEELLLLTVPTNITKTAVANSLGKNYRTIDNYIKNGIFQEGVHYFVNEIGKKEFIPAGIIDFKRNKNHKKDRKEVEIEKKIFHPSVKNIVQGLNIG